MASAFVFLDPGQYVMEKLKWVKNKGAMPLLQCQLGCQQLPVANVIVLFCC